MSEELMDDDIRYLRKWLNEENTSPVDRVALATVLHEVINLRDRMGGSEGLHRINSHKIKFLKDQLAVSQAHIKVLREALEMMMLPMPHKDETPLSICKAISARAQEALAQPTDDTILREMLAKEREKVAKVLAFAKEYVEAWDNGMAGDSSLLYTAKDAIRAMEDE